MTKFNRVRFIEIVGSVASALGVSESEGGEVMVFLESLRTELVRA